MKFIVFIILLGGLMFHVGCSDVNFSTKPSETCQNFNDQFGDESCVKTKDGLNKYNYTETVGKVDILFVDDNSGSMWVEQNKMATRFNNFVSKLNIENVDWRIGIITTDVSNSPGNSTQKAANGFGDFQDGKFLKFPNGQKVLKNTTSNYEQKFKDTIARSETKVCEDTIRSCSADTSQCNNLIRQNCPSGDERGIFALNLALDRGQSGFFRSSAHLAVVILSDEDERTNGGEISGYPLEPYDLPESFVAKVNEKFGSSKLLSVHSVIIKPGDSSCKSTQDSQNFNGRSIRGHYGLSYEKLSNPSDTLKSMGSIIDGHLGTICANDYATQMGNIGSKISQNIKSIQLVCEPEDGTVEITLEPDTGSVNFTIDSENRLVLSPAAPAGTKVNLSYSCDRTQ